MSYLTHNDIYFHTQINRRVSLNPRFLDENFAKFIEKIVKNNVEGKCVKEGYVVPGTTIILERSMGNLNNNQFNGNLLFDVKIGVKICNIPLNSVVKAPIIKINKLGLLAELGPLMIIVPKEIHVSKDAFKDIKIGDEIELLIIGKTFELNSKKISVYAKLNSESNSKMNVSIRKGEKNTKNTLDKIVESSFVYKELDEEIDIKEDEDVDIEDDEEGDGEGDEDDSDLNEELEEDEEEIDVLEDGNEQVGDLDENEDPLDENEDEDDDEEEEIEED